MEFSEFELDDRLLKVVEENGYKKPTIVQQEVIPSAMSGFDILADAPTGTGKTAAFVLPCLQHLIDFSNKRHSLCRILMLTPTRELAMQVHEQVKSFSRYLPRVTSCTVIGGVDHEDQLPELSQKTDIVIATPGRLIEYLKKKLFDIKGVEILILDEADRMLDMGFYDDVMQISKMASRREQTFLFSATLEGGLLKKFANEVLKNPVEIHVDSPRSEKKKITQYKIYADDLSHKIELLKYLLKSEKINKTVVFIKTRERLQELVSELDSAGLVFAYLRGEMDQDKRLQALERFTNNDVKILLATDVAARGIDVADITHVINFDMPRSADIYVHRIGRTGRAGRKGVAINLVEAHDVPMLGKIERYTGEKITLRVIDGLKAKNKLADFSKKKRKPEDRKEVKKDEKTPHKKDRVRSQKNKGKPNFAEKRLRKNSQVAGE
jgi:ATP-dependent RNA helicase SrmB